MQQLLFSPAAQNDLESIYDYTFQTWGVDQAEYYARELHKVCHDLATGKIKGSEVDFIRSGYFKKPYKSHFVFYRQPSPKLLEVVRILHQRMDLDAHLS